MTTVWKLGMMLMCAACISDIALAQTNAQTQPVPGTQPQTQTQQVTTSVNLTTYLQAEVNEIALLTAQWNNLQQQGDPIGAAVIASYIPDHQMQANLLAATITAQGGNPSLIQPNAQPFLGNRAAVVQHDIQAHETVLNSYRQLQQTSTDPTIQRLAIMGQGGAGRHLSSLIVARATTDCTMAAITNGLVAALAMERSAVADLQTQAAQLTQLGDTTTANAVQAMIPAHQQQISTLEALVTQMGGNPALATPLPTVALATRSDIIAHLNVVNTQFVNTYALPIAAFPNNPIRTAFMQGQQVALSGLTQVQALIPAPVPTV